MPNPIRPAALLLLLLSGCTLLPEGMRERLPDLAMPDFSSWFNRENAVEVAEVRRTQQCRAPDGQTRVQLLGDQAAVQALVAERGLRWDDEAEPLADAPHALIDLGRRGTEGYGLAVSRQAGLKDEIFLLKATVFEPQPGDELPQSLSSPCVLVRLPERQYAEIRVINQAGRVLARSR
ncbi:MAG TPA: protease complex subunit PrcB family protein [Nevskiaceae bacterium]|nr:protease complex subunit PrcB family protein [Nevskiaceae bacterium]